MSMWFVLVGMIFALIAMLYIPGSLFMRAFSLAGPKCVALAPLYSICSYSVLGVLYPYIGIRANPCTMILPTLIIALLAWGISLALKKRSGAVSSNTNYFSDGAVKKHARLNKCAKTQQFISSGDNPPYDHPEHLPSSQKMSLWMHIKHSEWTLIALYVLVGAFFTTLFYLGTLDGADSFVQDSDNSWHLALIRSFADSGNMSLLQTSLFYDLQNTVYNTVMPTGGSFYPAAWHLLAALLVNIFPAPVTVAANAINTVAIGVIFALSIYSFLCTFHSKRSLLFCGLLVVYAFLGCPWGMLYHSPGPIFPNFLGYTLAPALFFIFTLLVKAPNGKARIPYIILFLIGCVATGTAHPNAIFVFILLAVPYLAAHLLNKAHDTRFLKPTTVKLLIVLAAIIGTALVWFLLFKMPFFKNTVSFNWPAFLTYSEELTNIIFLGFRFSVKQILLALFVVLGIIHCLRAKKNRWIIVSYGIACLFCFIGATTDGFIKQYLTGFWYTDPLRLGGMAALFAIPLASMGVLATLLFIKSMAHRTNSATSSKIPTVLINVFSIAAIVIFCAFNYNALQLPGNALGYFVEKNAEANLQDRSNLFDQDEQQFVKQVAKIVDPSETIYNCADDGSPFAYALDGLNLSYRRSSTDGQTQIGSLLQHKIDEVAYNEQVQQVLRAADIHYILILDLGGEPTSERCYYGYYDASKWEGINTINDNTPGLTCLLAEGDMRLYKIDAA